MIYASPNLRKGLLPRFYYRQRGEFPPRKLNVKTSPPFSLYFAFSILLVFNKLFFVFFGIFPIIGLRFGYSPDLSSFLRFFQSDS